jgi:hypothetical protein
MLRNAYYFRHHMYTLVPRHVREDMAWLADAGTQVVSLAILEQDLYAARQNVEIICREADRVGMHVHAVPSRWGGLVAGAPKVPSRFTIDHPEAASTDAGGRPHIGVSGPIASVHHPACRAFFVEALETMLTQWPIAGVVWDEVKNLDAIDHSTPAKKRLGDQCGQRSAQVNATVAFFGDMNRHIKSLRPEAVTTLFLYAHCQGEEVPGFAATPKLDYFGCDGRPWSIADGGTTEDGAGQKCLLDHGPRFLEAARRGGTAGFLLIENHNLASADLELVDRRLGDVLSLAAEHVAFYYYPRNVADPNRLMEIIGRHLAAAAA